jgi:hypothetical protein
LISGVLLSAFAFVLLIAGMFLPDLRSLRGGTPVVVEQGSDLNARERIPLGQVDERAARLGAEIAPLGHPNRWRIADGDASDRYFDRLQDAQK